MSYNACIMIVYPLFMHITYKKFVYNRQIPRMSQLLFKIMALSYTRHHQQRTCLQDCLSALSSKTSAVSSILKQQLHHIREIRSQATQQSNPANEMSVIMEEETERSVGEGMGTGFGEWMGRVREEFNGQIGEIVKIERNVEKLANMYKSQLVEISKEAHLLQGKNEKLKKENKRLKDENNQLKDQLTAETAHLFMDGCGEPIQSVFDIKGTAGKCSAGNKNEETPKFKIKSQEKSKKEEIKKPFTKQQKQKNKKTVQQLPTPKQSTTVHQSEPNIIQINIKQKELDEDLQKWRKLSKKIDQLKHKLVVYEQQIEEKNQQIAKLKNQLKGKKIQDQGQTQQRKKLKTANTTLRGEKTVMQNQLASLKKQLVEKTELCSVQDSQISQLKTQVHSFNETIKWQNSLIQQLRSSIAKQTGRQKQEYQERITKLVRTNQQLYKFITKQQQQAQQINRRSAEIEGLLDQKLKAMMGRVTELQMILDEKNECIVRMKAKGIGNNQNANPNIPNTPHSQTVYLNELVRVLTKKVADRDEIIRRLEQLQQQGI